MTEQTNTGLALAAPQSIFKPTGSVFHSLETMAEAQQKAEILSRSKFIPVAFQNKPDECLIALDFAGTVGVNVLQVMQNLHVVEGLPGWKSPFVLGAIRTCGRFTNVRLVLGQEGIVARAWVTPSQGTGYEVKDVPNLTCYVSATDLEGQQVKGTTVSIAMAVAEGWYGRKGSKWPNMPEQMLQYRAGSFFGRIHIQDVLLGMHTADELQDFDTYAVAQDENGTGAVEMLTSGVTVAPAKERAKRGGKAAPAVVPVVPPAEPAESITDATVVAENKPGKPAPAVAAEPDYIGEIEKNAGLTYTPAPEPTPATAPAVAAAPVEFQPDPEVAKHLARAMALGFQVKNEAGEVETEENTDYMETDEARQERIKVQLKEYFANRKSAAAASATKPAAAPTVATPAATPAEAPKETAAEKATRVRNETQARQYHGGEAGETAVEKVLREKREQLAAKNNAPTPVVPIETEAEGELDELFPEA